MGREEDDLYAPPRVACEVTCLRCGETYESFLIRWVEDATCAGGGYWGCPTPDCDGQGFMLDIHPLDQFCWLGDDEEIAEDLLDDDQAEEIIDLLEEEEERES
jgi:hypothetical protein